MKLSLGVNFINVISTNFVYECCFGSFLEKAAETMFVRKIRTYNVDEIDGRSFCQRKKDILAAKMMIKTTNFHSFGLGIV
jgi:hypothetical protein